MIHGGIFSGNMDNYDLYLRQKWEHKKEPSKRRETPKHEIPQTDLKPSSKSIKRCWPTIWNIAGTIPKFTNLQYPHATPKSHDTRFQTPTNISLENFAIYVTETDYFMSNFTPITADWLQDLKENKQVINVDNYNIRVAKMENSNYFNMLLETYITTFLSGISFKNLTDDNTPNVIKSIACFHVYYTIARFMKNPSLMCEYITPEVIKAVRAHTVFSLFSPRRAY